MTNKEFLTKLEEEFLIKIYLEKSFNNEQCKLIEKIYKESQINLLFKIINEETEIIDS